MVIVCKGGFVRFYWDRLPMGCPVHMSGQLVCILPVVPGSTGGEYLRRAPTHKSPDTVEMQEAISE